MPEINLNHTLSTLERGSAVARILQTALDAADPAQAIFARFICRDSV